VTSAIAVPAALALLALVDAGFAGFRACTGRNARIRKRAYHVRAARRGIACGAVGLSVVAVLIVITLACSTHPVRRYDTLIQAGTRMLDVLVPFAAVVAASLVAYWVLPMRGSTFVILVGLGPFTMLRPALVAGATAWSVVGSTDWLVWICALSAALSVLTVEPIVHRRWYRDPL
jgi:hypothetical protein